MTQRIMALSVLAAALLAAGGYGLHRAGVQQGSRQNPPAAAMATPDPAAAGAARKILYWHDPMVPGQKFDKPGKSPFMDMQLVPVYAEAGSDGGVRISAQAQQNLGMRTALAGMSGLATAIDTIGTVAYNERDVALVQARSNGFVERLFVRAPLDAVRRGQPLAALYVPEWQAAQEEYLSVRRMGAAAPAGLLEAARVRLRIAGMPDDLVAQVVARDQVQTRMTLTAPIAGVVTELSAREGMTVMAGAPLFRINGLATVWLNAEVPEDAATRLRPGNPVEARTAALPGTVFTGRVGAILPEVNAVTRSIRARIEIANPAARLVPGMFANVRLAPAPGAQVVTVPSEAVIRTGTRSVVMLAQGDNGFMPVEVETGAEANGLTEIRKGVSAGQKVVVSGQFLVDSEASLKGFGARTGASAAGSATPAATPAAMPAATPDPATRAAPETPAAETHHGVGRIEKIAPDGVTISHGPIASLQWGSMTMAFKPPPAGLPPGIAVGDTVGFGFKAVAGGSFQITGLAPQPSAIAPGRRHDRHDVPPVPAK